MTEPFEPPPPRRPWATHIPIPTLWTPEQARAVVELLDDLQEAILSLYAQQIQDLVREEQRHGDVADLAAGGEDLTDDRPV